MVQRVVHDNLQRPPKILAKVVREDSGVAMLLTDESAAVVEERRYEPFGAALDSVNDTGVGRLTSGFPDEQPEQDD